MRVTNSMLVSNFMNNLNTSMTKFEKIGNQLATGRKFAHISDDPVALIYSQQARNKLNKLAHYQQNVTTAQEWLTESETALLELSDIITSAYESCISAATDVKNESGKQATAEYLLQLRDQYVDTLNTTFGDKYVFGGYATTGYNGSDGVTPPFTIENVTAKINVLNADGTPAMVQSLDVNGDPIPVLDEGGNQVLDESDNPVYEMEYVYELETDEDGNEIPGQYKTVTEDRLFFNGVDLKDPEKADVVAQMQQDCLNFDVGVGTNMDVTFNGLSVVFFTNKDGTTGNMFDVLNELYNKVAAGAPADDINDSITPLQSMQSHVLNLTAEIGGRAQRLEFLATRYETDNINYTQMLSDAEDADEAEVIMNYKMAEAVYKAALSTGSYIIQPTLMDFLS